MPGAAQASPRDEQWYLDQIKAGPAQQVARGAGVTIGMLLSGLAVDHPDLQGRIRPGVRFDAEGRPVAGAPEPDVSGWDTALAVLAVGTGAGLLGVAPEATVMPASYFSLGATQSLAVRWLVDHGARVVLVSPLYGMTPETAVDSDTLRYALSRDCVVILPASVAAAAPAQDKTGVLVVGSVDRQGRRPAASGGGRIDLAAPAEPHTMIHADGAPDRGSQYADTFLQTDVAAAALVAGVTALVRSRYPELTAGSVIGQLLRTATDAGPPGHDDQYGSGVVDAEAAVTAPASPVATNPLGEPGPPSASRRAGGAGATGPERRTVVLLGAAAAALVAVAGLTGVAASRRRSGR